MYGTQSLLFFASGGELSIFGLAPLHALAIGYFARMVLGMASRVTLGHSGHPLVLDKFSWLLFIGFQAAVLLRILPDLLPDAFGRLPGAISAGRTVLADLLHSLGSSLCSPLLASAG